MTLFIPLSGCEGTVGEAGCLTPAWVHRNTMKSHSDAGTRQPKKKHEQALYCENSLVQYE